MWLRDTYSTDFEEIVDLVWNIYNKIPTDPQRSHLCSIKSRLSLSQRRHWTTFTIQKEDIEQELSLLWLRYSKNYKGNRTPGALKDYLLQCSVLGMQTFFNRHLATPSHAEPRQIPNWHLLEFQLDLKFLAHGTDYWPLCNLSPYERYLIFLKFKEEKSIIEVAWIVQKARRIVSIQLKNVLNRLRSEINESKNTR